MCCKLTWLWGESFVLHVLLADSWAETKPAAYNCSGLKPIWDNFWHGGSSPSISLWPWDSWKKFSQFSGVIQTSTSVHESGSDTHTKIPSMLIYWEVSPRREFIAHEVSISASGIRFCYDLGGWDVRLNITLGFRTIVHFSCRVISVEMYFHPYTSLSREHNVFAQFLSMSALPPYTLAGRPALVAFILRAYQSLWHSNYFTDQRTCTCYSRILPLSHTLTPTTILRLLVSFLFFF